MTGCLLGSACDIGRNHNVFQRREFRQQLVELKHKTNMLVAEIRELLLRQGGHIDRIDTHRAGIRTIQRTDNLQEGRLTSATGADDTYHLTLIDREVDTFQNFQRAKALFNAFDFYHNNLQLPSFINPP